MQSLFYVRHFPGVGCFTRCEARYLGSFGHERLRAALGGIGVAIFLAGEFANLEHQFIGDFSQREWIIFEALLQRPGQIVSKSQIEDQIYAFDSEVESNTIEVHISRLRKKLGAEVIETERGLGYRLGQA